MTLSDLPNAYPVELTPPDIAPWREGNTGVDYVHRFDSGRPGPHAMIAAIVHGNEPCGALALASLFDMGVAPVAGAVSLAFVNVEAYARFDPADPNVTRWVDEDFNRLWGPGVLDDGRQSVERTRARELRPYLDTVDLLLDIHSMQHPTLPLMMAGPLPKGRALAHAVGVPAHVVSDAGHAAGVRMRDYGGFADPASPKNAVLVECGQHWEAEAAPRALEAAIRFLRAAGVVAANSGADFLATRPAPPPQRFIEVTEAVTIRSDVFTFAQPFRGLETLARAGDLIGHDGDAPVVAPYDGCVLIMPSKRLWRGQTAVRLGRFIET